MTREDSGTSRRQFVRAVGASGAAVGLTGYVDGEAVGEVQQNATTVQWATDSDFEGDVWENLQEVLYDNGLSQDIEIDVVAGPNVTDNRRDQYQQWLSAGRGQPDILYVDSGWTLPFVAREQLLNLSQSDVFPQDAIDTIDSEYFEASVSTAKGPDGDLFAVPLFPDFPTMQYNKNYLREAGYGDDDFDQWATEPMQWQQFSEITREALDANDVRYGFTFQAQAYEGLSCCDFNEFMTSWGGAYFGGRENLFGPVGDRPITVNEQPVHDAIRMVRTFIHGSDAQNTLDDYAGDIAPSGVLQWAEEPSRKPFTNGNAVMHRNWPYSINISGEEENLGEDLGVMPLPYAVSEDEAEYPGTGGTTAALGGWHNAINPNSNNQEAAAKVLQAMMSEEFKLALFEELGFLPPEPELLDTDRAQEVPIMGRYLDSVRVAGEDAMPRPVTVAWPQESQRIAQQVNRAFAQGGNPEQAMSQLEQQLQQIEQSA
jgi:ABC-type glycerol-3-phosphate transport system substrate-binding protein